MARGPGWRAPLGGAAVALCLWGAHRAHRVVDDVRFEEDRSDLYSVLPNPTTMKVASLGFNQLAADLLWIRTVLTFSDVLERGGASGTRWLRAMLQGVEALDPRWRTLYFFGGAMLRVCGDIEGSDLIYSSGHEAFPQDPIFPFSLGMNAYLYRSDVSEAVRWVQLASTLPGAPQWYSAAAAGFLDRHGQRGAALRYLKEEMEATEDPGVLASLQARYRSLAHDELAERLEEERQRYRAARGQDIRDPADLGALPDDPEGGAWIIGADGLIRSSRREQLNHSRAVRQERALLAEDPVKKRP